MYYKHPSHNDNILIQLEKNLTRNKNLEKVIFNFEWQYVNSYHLVNRNENIYAYMYSFFRHVNLNINFIQSNPWAV